MSVSGPKKEVSVSTDKVDGGEATGSEGVVLEGGSSPVIYRKNREVSKKDMKTYRHFLARIVTKGAPVVLGVVVWRAYMQG